MRKEKKKKKPCPVSAELAVTPAYARFCDIDVTGEIYRWESWGLVIRHLRDYVGMEQNVFGRLLQGYTRSQISRYETEVTEPPIEFWVKMMRMFGLNICWALTGEGLPYITEYQDSKERERLSRWAVLIAEKENFLDELGGFD